MFSVLDLQTILLAFFGGLLPAIIWLFFWLQENDAHPEPNRYIILTFIYGMLGVPLALAIQFAINSSLLGHFDIKEGLNIFPITGLIVILSLAATEEIFKYLAAYQGGLKRRKIRKEPMDDVIYMITAALGFAALENTLFLIGPLLDGNTELAIITGNFRFVGATLLHVASSAIIGMFSAFSYFKLQKVKKRYFLSGFILAIGLHAAFNLFIIKNDGAVLLAFLFVWILIIAIIFLFEKIKSIHVEQIKIKNNV